MAWTKEQEKAIFDRGTSIIVSAGAGSGKTAVLSERILEYCKSGGDIRKILVLTFTKAAAMEMKERIRKKLIENDLKLQSDYIDAAYITTFDSYSLALVKKYYYKLGIKKDVAIMDSLMANIKRHEIITGLFKEYYEDNNEAFFSFLRKYTTQDDKEIVKIVSSICDKLDLLIDIDGFINSYEATYFNNKKIDEIVNDYIEYAFTKRDELLDEMSNLLDSMATDVASTKVYDVVLEAYNRIKEASDYTDLYNAIQTAKLGTASKYMDEGVKALKAKVGEMLTELKKNVFNKYIFIEDMKNEIEGTREDILFLLATCKEVLDRLFKYKQEVNLFSFSDIARLAIRLVKEFSDVRDELKYYYDEILVDEYQDTSDMQESFLSEIENHNRYMVGDIKQSIYRFRNANPYIFKEKYDSFSKGNGGEKIDLTFNFRSRREVLDNINLLFNKLMTNSCGDADYAKEHQMRYGQKGYEQINQEVDFNLEVLSYNNDEMPDLATDEKEAFIVGREIKKILAEKPMVLKGSSFKPVGYSDFAILIDKAKSFTTFKKIFEYLGIPLMIEADLDLKDSILPQIFTNILILINGCKNKQFDKAFNHAKASLARSFIYEYSDDQIYRMLLEHEKMDIDNDIYYLASLDNISYSSLFYEICDRMQIYDKLSLIGNVDNSLVILESIHSMLNSLNKASLSLNEACDYLIEAFSSDAKMPYTLSEGNKDSVRIMTIHKSKGLEFAYCYFPLLSSKFNTADQRESVGLSKEYGIYIPYADEGKSNTIIKPLVANKINLLDISEKVRLLYVALTRAREKMILIMEDKEYEGLNPKKLRSFHEMISYADVFKNYTKEIKLEDYNMSGDYKRGSIDKIDIKGSQAFTYNIMSKPTKLHRAHISKELSSIPDANIIRGMELGTLIHEALEVIDFKSPDIESLPVDDFVKAQVRGVLDMDIFNNISEARIYHEHEFYFNDNNEAYHGIIDLMLEYPDHIDIIDYKLADTSSSDYIHQLDIYKRYAASKSAKPIFTYLLSILHKELKKIEL